MKYFGVPANDLPTFDLSPFFYPAAEFIHQALTSGGKSSTRSLAEPKSAWNHQQVFVVFVFLICRKGVGALCCGRESLRSAGPGLPDDSPSPHSPVFGALRAAETLDFSKQRLHATAHRPGQRAAGRPHTTSTK